MAQQNQQNPLDNDDDFDFGGFEAADPQPAAQGMQAEAQASPWAAFALGNAQERPDLLCAQNRFPPYLDPSDIAGASADSRNMAAIDNNAAVQPLPSVAADLLGNAQFVERSDGPEQIVNHLNDLNPNGRLPDLGLGINDNRLFGQPLMNGPAATQPSAAIPVPDHPPLQVARNDDVSAADGAVPLPQPPEVVDVEPNNAVLNGARLEEGDEERNQPRVEEAVNVNNIEEERSEFAQRLESLTERNRVLEEELEQSRNDLAAQRSRLQEMETRHSETLTEVRRAGQDALSVVVEEYKEQLKTVMLQQQETSQRQLLEALREQATGFQELLEHQKQKHEEERNLDKEEVKRNVEKAVEDSRTESQERFQVFLQEEQEKWREDLEKAVQEERAASQTEIQRVINEEQSAARERLDQARAEYSKLLEDERKRQEEALSTVRLEEAERAREHMSSLVTEERERGRVSVREALEAAQADTRSYIDEQRRRDSSIRQRHLSSLDLFLESCRQQVTFLMNHEQNGDGAILQQLPPSNRRDQRNKGDENNDTDS